MDRERLGWFILASLILIVLISLVRGILYAVQYPSREVWNDVFEQQHNELLRMMDCIHRTLSEFHLNYFIHGGTLIGAVRHGDIIKWDDDMDLVLVVPKDPLKFELFQHQWNAVLTQLEADSIIQDWSLPKVVNITQLVSAKFVKHRLHIDVNFYETALKNDRLIYQSKSALVRSFASQEYYYVDEVYPLKEYSFRDGKHVYNGPSQPWAFLSRAYPNFHLKARLQIPHVHSVCPMAEPWCLFAASIIGDFDLTEEEKQRALSFMTDKKSKKSYHVLPSHSNLAHSNLSHSQTNQTNQNIKNNQNNSQDIVGNENQNNGKKFPDPLFPSGDTTTNTNAFQSTFSTEKFSPINSSFVLGKS